MMKKPLRILVFAVGCQLSAVSCLLACPLCVDATPYKHGLLMAVFVLLPVPFVLIGGLLLWIRKAAKAEAAAETQAEPPSL